MHEAAGMMAGHAKPGCAYYSRSIPATRSNVVCRNVGNPEVLQGFTRPGGEDPRSTSSQILRASSALRRDGRRRTSCDADRVSGWECSAWSRMQPSLPWQPVNS